MEPSRKCPVSAGWVTLCGSQGRGRGHRRTDIYSNPGVVCGHWTGDKRWTQMSEVGAKFHPQWRSLCWKRQTEKAADVWRVPAVWEINLSSCKHSPDQRSTGLNKCWSENCKMKKQQQQKTKQRTINVSRSIQSFTDKWNKSLQANS